MDHSGCRLTWRPGICTWLFTLYLFQMINYEEQYGKACDEIVRLKSENETLTRVDAAACKFYKYGFIILVVAVGVAAACVKDFSKIF